MFNMGADPEPKIYGRDKHGIARTSISHGALKVCEILRAHNHSAYIVGGAVRDLLLGVVPEGLRRRHRCASGGDSPPVPALAPDRPALQAGARAVRPGDGRSVHLPRRRRRGSRRARAAAARQRLRHARAGCGAARFHRQRPVLRPPRRDRARLPRRLRRRAQEDHAHHRRRAPALSRGSGAHAARGALRRQARLQHRPEDARADPRAGRPDRERARGAAVRGNAEAAAVGPFRSLPARSCARKACTTACCRCWT